MVKVSERSQKRPQSEPSAGHLERNERWIVWIVAICVMASVMNGSMLNVSLPVIGEAFDVNPARLGWLVTIYSLAFGIGTPFYGRLGDRYGLRRMFVIGLSIFVVASLLAGLAPSFPLVMLFRVGQALGSAAVPSLGTAMVARAVSHERRGQAMGVISMAVGVGAALGPVLGGALTDLVSWRMVFLVSAGLGFLIPFCLRFLPRDVAHEADPVDWFGGVTLGATIGGLLLGITGLQREGATSLLVIVSFSIAAVGFALTFWRQRIAPYPFIERVLLGNRRYLLLCLIGFCTMAGNLGVLVVAPFLFQEGHGLSAGMAGLALMPSAVAVALLSRTAGRFADRFNPFVLITAGLATMLAMLLVAVAGAVSWTVIAITVLLAVFGIGQAFVNAPLSTTLTRTVPARVYGAGLGIYNMMFFVGAGFGAAVSTALLTARDDAESAIAPVYSGSDAFIVFSDALLPSGILIAVAIIALRIAAKTNVPKS